jgi:hypothetical protein
MSARLRKYLPLIEKIVKAKPAKRLEILREGDSDFLKCLCECAINLLNANVPVDQRQISNLEKHKTLLRILANRKVSLKTKKNKLLRQGGKILLALLRPILQALVANLITLP